jgi:hypothetical protein
MNLEQDIIRRAMEKLAVLAYAVQTKEADNTPKQKEPATAGGTVQLDRPKGLTPWTLQHGLKKPPEPKSVLGVRDARPAKKG